MLMLQISSLLVLILLPASVIAQSPEKVSLGARTLLPAPVWVIGSYDAEGKPNMMTASWVGICCSNPPCVTISLRKATYTYGNIMKRMAYTVNIPSADFAGEANYYGSVSGRDVDKLAKTGQTAVKSALVDAPYLKEFPLVAECKVIHTYEAGSHTLFIGQIMDVKADPSVLNDRNVLVPEKLDPFFYVPGPGTFYRAGTPVDTSYPKK